MAPKKEERAQHHEKWWHTLLPPKKIYQKVVLGQQIIKTNKKRPKQGQTEGVEVVQVTSWSRCGYIDVVSLNGSK